MQSDEQLYELSAKELAESPRQGLLIKCMAKSEGDENKGKALYIETRVEEMKEEIREGLKRQKAEEARKTSAKKASSNTILTTDVPKPRDDPFQGSSMGWWAIGIGLGLNLL